MELATDGDGFLLNPNDWSEEVAALLAAQDGRKIDDTIMGYIHQAREMYENDSIVPPLRKFCKETGTSKQELYETFQMGPMKLICKWGGLPKPTGCV